MEGLGVQKGWGAGGPPLGEKKSDFKILVLEMSYFNCNNRQILKIHMCTFIFFANKGEGNIPPQLLSGGGLVPPPPAPVGNPVSTCPQSSTWAQLPADQRNTHFKNS